MEINIRNQVIGNLKGISQDDLNMSIQSAITSTEEKTLPGLGVLFELMWQQSSDNDKSNIINTISNQL